MTNLIGNTFLVPILGGKGAAISTGISYIVFFVLRTLFGMRYYQFRIMSARLIIITIILIGNAVYNTFASFGSVSLLLYVASIIILILLYIDVVRDIGKMVTSYFAKR